MAVIRELKLIITYNVDIWGAYVAVDDHFVCCIFSQS